jgi:uncharacterized membrane protein (DUF4010 family)
MIEFEFLQKISLVLAIGLIVGLKRQKNFVGNFSVAIAFVISGLFGLLSVYFGSILNNFLIIIVSFSSICIFTAVGHLLKYKKLISANITTDIALILIFLIGALAYFDSYPFIITISVGLIIALFLESKKQLHNFYKTLTIREITNAVVFLMLTLIILPILPNHTIDRFNSINPYKMCLSLVLVMSVSFISYMLMKIPKIKKTLFISSIFGGIASSTATTVSMAYKAKSNQKFLNTTTFVILVASSIMFAKSFILALIINPNLGINLLIKLIIVCFIGCLLSYAFWERKVKIKEHIDIEIGSPINIKTIIRFIFVYIAFSISAYFIKNFSFTGFYTFLFVYGLLDVDAVTINLAQMSLQEMNPSIVSNGILIATLGNTTTKWFLVYWLGNRKNAIEVGKIFIVLIILSSLLMTF